MSDTEPKPSQIEEGQELAKISPKKIEADSSETAKKQIETLSDETKNSEAPISNKIENERSLLLATRLLLREYGIRKSGAAIREAVEMPHETYMPMQAVSALSVLGFKSSFGSIKIKKLKLDYFPLIAFLKDGTATVVKELNSKNE